MNSWLVHKFNDVEQNHWWWRGRRVLVRDLLKREEFDSLLDLGCGTGQTMLYLEQCFPAVKIEGVDNSRTALLYAKKRYELKVYDQDVQKLVLKKKYGAVVCLDVLEHLQDDVKALKKAAQALEPGGIIVVTSPALPFIWSQHDSGQGHFRRYTKKSISQIGTEAGLVVEKVTYFNFIFSPLIIFIRLLSRVARFSAVGDYDNKINYDVVASKLLNNLLTAVFWVDVKCALWFGWPWGISVVALFRKSGRE